MAFTTVTATFNAAQPLDGDLPYIDITGLTYASASAYAIAFGSSATDYATGGGVGIIIKDASRTATGFRVLASDQFTGKVELLLYDI